MKENYSFFTELVQPKVDTAGTGIAMGHVSFKSSSSTLEAKKEGSHECLESHWTNKMV